MAKRGDAGEQQALALDRLGEREPAAGERVPATRLGESSDERLRARLQEKQPAIDPARAELREALGQRGERGAPRIHAHRHALVPRLGEEVRHAEEQRRRQVVHAIVAAVLEHVERDALPRTGKAADQDELH